MRVAIAGEGPLDLAILRRLLGDAGLAVDGALWGTYGKGGKDGMTPRLPQWAAGAARGLPVVALRDLDHDATCAPMLRARLMPALPPGMLLRIAVRAAEAWLIADRDGLAEWLEIGPRHLPGDPEAHPNPKHAVLEAAMRSANAAIREGVPPGSSGRRQGPDYNTTLIGFVYRRWQPEVAARRSPSLHRARERIGALHGHLANLR